MEFNKILPGIGILLIIILFIFRDFYIEKDIDNNEKVTLGEIIEFRTHYQARYSIVYQYSVDNITYTGNSSVSFFRCDNGNKGCVGNKFSVFYSSKNPSHSRIDLGKYEKYR